MNGADIIAIVILAAIVIAIIVYLLHWLYRHSSKDLSFVRTGYGGERVVMGGMRIDFLQINRRCRNITTALKIIF